MAGVGLLHRVLLVGVHLEELADALLLALGGVEDRVALGDLAGVDAHVDELAVEGVGGHLGGQGGEGGLLVGRTGEHLLLVADGVALDVGDVERGGQVVQDGVEHGLDALVLEGGPGQDREGLTGHGELADAGLELGDAELLALEVLLHEGVVGLGDRLDQLPRSSSALATSSEGISSYSTTEPRVSLPSASFSGKRMARISRTSTRPENSFSAPIGKLRTIGVAWRRSRMVWTEKSKSAPSLSILLM